MGLGYSRDTLPTPERIKEDQDYAVKLFLKYGKELIYPDAVLNEMYPTTVFGADGYYDGEGYEKYIKARGTKGKAMPSKAVKLEATPKLMALINSRLGDDDDNQ